MHATRSLRLGPLPVGVCLLASACDPSAAERSDVTIRQELLLGAPMTVDARLIEQANGRWRLACMGRFRNLGVSDGATYAASATFFEEGAQRRLINGQVSPAAPILNRSAQSGEITITHPSADPAGSLTVRTIRGPVDPKRHRSCQVVIKRNGNEVMRALARPAQLVVKPSGTFVVGSPISVDMQEMALGDLDRDGDLDALSGDFQGNTALWKNDGLGVLTSATLTPTSEVTALALGDLDGDGDLDAVQGNASPADVVWLNDGTGGFTSGQSLGNHVTLAVALGDLDGDGDLDIFQATYNQANRVWLNDGSAVFTDSLQQLGNHRTAAVALEDLDSDGDLDAFEGNLHQENRVWLNDGLGVFTDSGQLIGNHATTSVALGDVDGDGDLDAFEGNGANQANRVWRNDGNGAFPGTGEQVELCPPFPCPLPLDTSIVALGDVDGDGDLDALEGAVQGSRVWQNNGVGVFTQSGPSFATLRGAAFGDLDSDGDLDAFGGGGALGAFVLFNQ